jgi:hypothetical protein
LLKPISAERVKEKRRRLLLAMTPLPPPTGGKPEIRVKGPEVTAGSGVRKNSASPSGFKPVVSVTSVPLVVKFKAEDQTTEAGCKAAS